jgi:hypothetical protein
MHIKAILSKEENQSIVKKSLITVLETGFE